MAQGGEPTDQAGLHFNDLHERHPGLTQEQFGAYYQAACVCLDRHHEPPKSLDVHVDEARHRWSLSWHPADGRTRRAHANELDATEEGAYAVSFACVEWGMDLVAVGRADHGTGADWYVAPPGHVMDENGLPDLDDPGVRALEVSGQDRGPIGGRLREKREQLLRGGWNSFGIAVVVGFERPIVRMQSADAVTE